MSFPVHWFNAFSLLALGCWVWTKYIEKRKRNPKNLPFPPGPKGYPIIGSLIENSAPFPWVQYARWCKEYGDLCYFEALGQPFLVLDSLERARDLLEKRSRNYSDRMWTTMLMDLMRWDYNLALLPYGVFWRRHRRQFHEHFNVNTAARYVPIQAEETKAFVKALLEDHTQQSFALSIRRALAGTIMRIVYGIRVDSIDNEYVMRAEAALGGVAEAGVFGSFYVDYFPFLKYIPSWLPGASFRRKAEKWGQVNDLVRQKPFALVKEQLRTNLAPNSVAKKLAERLPSETDPTYKTENGIAEDVTGVAFIAGADTTLSSIHSFFLAMAMHPELMQQGQDEIDRVVGSNRLPTMDDQPSLPFIQAICKELLRWHNVLPLALPHMTSEDDVYGGYFIPKGTLVFANAWSILHNEKTFEKPFEFMPSRYLKDGEIDHTVLDGFLGGTFGYGRRICPGRYVAGNTLFLMVSNLLAVYNIFAPLGADGKPQKLSYKSTSGLLIYPEPVSYRIEPRNPRAAELARSG